MIIIELIVESSDVLFKLYNDKVKAMCSVVRVMATTDITYN